MDRCSKVARTVQYALAALHRRATQSPSATKMVRLSMAVQPTTCSDRCTFPSFRLDPYFSFTWTEARVVSQSIFRVAESAPVFSRVIVNCSTDCGNFAVCMSTRARS